jgi:hypothetical protein
MGGWALASIVGVATGGIVSGSVGMKCPKWVATQSRSEMGWPLGVAYLGICPEKVLHGCPVTLNGKWVRAQ